MSLRTRLGVACALVMALCVASATASADGDTKRAVPDYDGRGNVDAEAGSWALWIPRGVLAPVYLVHEYLVRWPIGAVVTRAERGRWLSEIHELFSFGDDQQYMVIPTAVYDFGLRPSIGLRFTADRLFAANHGFVAHAATGGTDWIVGSLRDRYRWNAGKTSLAGHVDLSRRPDLMFMGIGPDVRESDRMRYGAQTLDAGVAFVHVSDRARVGITAGARRLAFRDAECCDEPALADEIRAGRVEAPPGFGASYTALYQGLELSLDSRDPRPAPGTGARIAMYGRTSFDTQRDQSWGNYGIALGGALDLNGLQRTLQLQIGADFVDPIRGDTVPFTELASLGGANTMQGFVTGWMVGRSTVVAELGYTWPVAYLFDGTARLAVGNAFGPRLDGFEPDRLRISGDLGITSIGARDSGFEIIVGLGTETFAQGGHIDSVRIAFGSRRGI